MTRIWTKLQVEGNRRRQGNTVRTISSAKRWLTHSIVPNLIARLEAKRAMHKTVFVLVAEKELAIRSLRILLLVTYKLSLLFEEAYNCRLILLLMPTQVVI